MPSPARDSGERDASIHKPVLLREVIRFLDLQPGLIVVDGTVGGGGHSRHILEHIGPEGKLIGLDRDPMMLRRAEGALTSSNCSLHQTSYADLPQLLEQLGIGTVDRILLDLGLSSDQLADETRGFGFKSGGLLDLRFDMHECQPAWMLIEQLDEEQLADLLHRYGEERFSDRIARMLIERRRTHPIRTSRDLVEAVREAVPQAAQQRARRHPATRVFQALRIAVNEELRHLETALRETLPPALTRGGRLVVISFHSLEDRLVKTEFRAENRWQNLTPKPITPRPVEQKVNPRSRTAKLRAAKKK